jgi:hypothetical protein
MNLDIESTKLLENISLTAEPTSTALISNGEMVSVTEKGQIVIYSIDGNQIKVLDKKGEGDLELKNPTLVSTFKDGFLVWCRDLLKMVAFDSEGNPIEEYFGFNHSIKKFVVKENLIFTYINTLVDKPFIQIYDTNEGEIIKEIGNTVNEQVISNLNSCGGGLTLYNDQIIFISSNSLNLYVVDGDEHQIREIKISDKDFNELRINEDAADLINNNQRNAIEMSLGSAVVTGLFQVGADLIVLGELGEMSVSGNTLKSNDRKSFIWKLDSDFKITGKYYFDLNPSISCKLVSSGTDFLTRIIEKQGEEEMDYYLEKLQFSTIQKTNEIKP